jgi:hypothetical protein
LCHSNGSGIQRSVASDQLPEKAKDGMNRQSAKFAKNFTTEKTEQYIESVAWK